MARGVLQAEQDAAWREGMAGGHCGVGAAPPASSPERPRPLYGPPGSSTVGPTPMGCRLSVQEKGSLEEAEYASGGNLRGEGPENGTP